ncbi:methyltransferase domain-containing protein [Arthrobacter bambusae]|uniref:methyltransferase domain-containing protein n=1 Tax=Arthrobacter bambusae TaxID=1338426 RepID=UPI00277FCBC2|nr:methyltransferase domain-containing protein [Arthrobacter bambusae]MDQ0028227.1 23S rRNA (guanine745-N1)-methyltransferase [Arthrobacter bambusae]MDQ0096979.1 23S rRNA (guanine745-N1)-methyltransferase [Arthrobacter bambusae]
MLSDAVPALRCPVCQGPLSLGGAPPFSLGCVAGHSFDAAKQGYFNLLTGKGTVFEADTAEMVAARNDFLGAGHYAPLAEAIAELAAPVLSAPGSLVLDSGTGTGHYLRTVLDRTPAAAIGIDISKFALRRAARLNPGAINLVWDIWRPLPIADRTVDAIMVVFAPRNPQEFARVVRPGGRVIVVTPRNGHLGEIAERTGMLGIEPGKDERLAESMQPFFTSADVVKLDVDLTLAARDLADVAFMGPAGHHLERSALLASTAGESSVHATAKFTLSVFTAPENGS